MRIGCPRFGSGGKTVKRVLLEAVVCMRSVGGGGEGSCLKGIILTAKRLILAIPNPRPWGIINDGWLWPEKSGQ